MKLKSHGMVLWATCLTGLLVAGTGCGDSPEGGPGSPTATGAGSGAGGAGGAGGDVGGSSSTGFPGPSSSSSGTGGGGQEGCIDEASQCEAGYCGFVPKCGGGVVECPTCPDGEVCGLEEPNKCGLPVATCTPKTAAEVCPGKCGFVTDGCDGAIECTGANGGLACGENQQCVGGDHCEDLPTCTPTTCAALGVACGQTGDGCGGVLDCDAEIGCEGGKVCGVGTESGTCVDPACVPLSLQEACANTCGVTGDGCGGSLDCESDPTTKCPDGQTCGGGGVPGECGSGQQCVPFVETEVCAGKCGQVSNGCGGVYTCSAANGGQTCDATQGESCGGGGVPQQCGKPACTPYTMEEACPGKNGAQSCGKVSDGCGGLVSCGVCPTGEICGLYEESLCGKPATCEPVPVATACAGKCGVVPDGCGGSYTCSDANGGETCVDPEFCGATSPNQCGVPESTCTPKTCAELGHTCGLASDGCGGQLDCWPTATKACPDAFQTCIADPQTGSQSCVGSGTTCTGPLCDDVPTTCASNSLSRLTGTVLTPGRLQNGNWINRVPVPNAVVYIPADPSKPLPAIYEGAKPNDPASCGRCEDEVLVATGETVLAAAVTDYKGEFTLEGNIPVGTDFNLVVKIGKWRRVVRVENGIAKACESVALPQEKTLLAKNVFDGLAGTHLPKIAISTGWVDEMECVFRNIGIDEREFSIPSESGRIHMYRANGARMHAQSCNGTYNDGTQNVACSANSNEGCKTSKSGCSWSTSNSNDSVSDTNLFGSATTLSGYDMIVGDCQGSEHTKTHNARIRDYVNNGGRLFASHFSYTWIEGNQELDNSAVWGTVGDADTGTGFISLPSGNTQRTGANPVKAPLFRDWLDYQGALDGTTAGLPLESPATPKFTIDDPRDRAGSNVGPATDEWVYRNRADNPSYPRVQQLSFNTPYGAADDQICGRVAYSGFHVSNANNDDLDDYFPGVCSNGELSAQEKILVFMLFDLGSCVSTGEPPKPPQCVPKTAAELCPEENSACGFLSDGCGGLVDCGGCTADHYCDGSTCKPKECTPQTCASLGYNCGFHPDGCGGIARDAQGNEGCGECGEFQECGLGGPGLCGSSACEPIAYETACPPNYCGQVSDGCGGVHECGLCPDGEVCGGAGPNQCGAGSCTPIPIETACSGLDCGYVSDGCGGSHECGACIAPESCGGGGTPNVCGSTACTPYTKETACAGLECGWVSDGCGGAIKCGDCPNNGVCGGAGPNLCGASCTPTTCEAEGAECGIISDECGGLVQCAPCPDGQVCGAVEPNKCGSGTCTPTTCSTQGAECGLIGDGCGKVLDCGVCTVEGETCGGAGVPNQCDPGEGGCTPTTCEAQGVMCGATSNGCGGLLDCGGCAPGASCQQGQCVSAPK